jgi:hypothetical protein
MSKHFEEARLVITADIVYDPDDTNNYFHQIIADDIRQELVNLGCLVKNIDVKLEGFICDGK